MIFNVLATSSVNLNLKMNSREREGEVKKEEKRRDGKNTPFPK